MMTRRLRQLEIAFLTTMLMSKPDAAPLASQLPQCSVEEMDDGGMGGLKFSSSHENRSLGPQIASAEFLDEDGITVIATLNLDNYGDLYELDIWKTDFSPLRRFPG